jgi:hypothetical protein
MTVELSDFPQNSKDIRDRFSKVKERIEYLGRSL